MKRHFTQITKFGCQSVPYLVRSEIIQCESGLTYIKVCSSRNNAADLLGQKFCREKLLLPPEINKKARALFTHKTTFVQRTLKLNLGFSVYQESSPSKMNKGIENFKNQHQWCLVFV